MPIIVEKKLNWHEGGPNEVGGRPDAHYRGEKIELA